MVLEHFVNGLEVVGFGDGRNLGFQVGKEFGQELDERKNIAVPIGTNKYLDRFTETSLSPLLLQHFSRLILHNGPVGSEGKRSYLEGSFWQHFHFFV